MRTYRKSVAWLCMFLTICDFNSRNVIWGKWINFITLKTAGIEKLWLGFDTIVTNNIVQSTGKYKVDVIFFAPMIVVRIWRIRVTIDIKIHRYFDNALSSISPDIHDVRYFNIHWILDWKKLVWQLRVKVVSHVLTLTYELITILKCGLYIEFILAHIRIKMYNLKLKNLFYNFATKIPIIFFIMHYFSCDCKISRVKNTRISTPRNVCFVIKRRYGLNQSFSLRNLRLHK